MINRNSDRLRHHSLLLSIVATLGVFSLLTLWRTPAASGQQVVLSDDIGRTVISPQGMTVCNGSLYTCDVGTVGGGKVRSLNLTTQAFGTAANGLSLPFGVACANGVLFVTELNGNRISRINPDATTTIVLQQPSGTSPRGIDALGSTLYFGGFGQDNGVWKWPGSGPSIRVAGTGKFGSEGDGGPAVSATLKSPGAVAVGSNGSVYIAEIGGNRIREVLPDGSIRTDVGDGFQGDGDDGQPARLTRINQPVDLKWNAGDLYIADASCKLRRIVNISGLGPSAISTTVVTECKPSSIAVDPVTASLFVGYQNSMSVKRYPLPGTTPVATPTMPIVAPPTSTPTRTPTATPTAVMPSATPTLTSPPATFTATSRSVSPTPTSPTSSACDDLRRAVDAVCPR